MSMTREISIHAPREGSDRDKATAVKWARISIHAPREGSDGHPREHLDHHAISIHAPREGSDTAARRRENPMRQFQSTLPVRGATVRGCVHQ